MNSGRILIVDDSDNIRSVLQMNFEWLGYQVSCANDGEEALRMVQEDAPDLIILDVMMPRRNGYQVCRTLKADPRFRGIPVIFLTAKDQKEDRFWGKDCGADEYLTKPFSAAKLERVIERLLEERSARPPVGDLTARVQTLKGRGEACTVAVFRLNREALAVFRQKYGEFKHQEALDGVRSTIEVVMRDDLNDFMIERSGEGTFRALLPCKKEKSETLAQRIKTQADLLLRSFYDKEDAERGHVLHRRGGSAQGVQIPLLSVDVAVSAEEGSV